MKDLKLKDIYNIASKICNLINNHGYLEEIKNNLIYENITKEEHENIDKILELIAYCSYARVKVDKNCIRDMWLDFKNKKGVIWEE